MEGVDAMSELIEQLNNLKSAIEGHRGLNQNGNALAFDIPEEDSQ